MNSLTRFLVLLGLVQLAWSIVFWRKMDIPQEESSPFPRTNTAAAPGLEGNDFFLFGGSIEDYSQTTGNYTHFNDLWLFTFDGLAGSWELVLPNGPSPSPRNFHSFEKVSDSFGNEVLYLFGGNVFGPNPFSVFYPSDYFWSFNVYTEMWTDLSSIPGPGPRASSLSFVFDNKLCIFGGVIPNAFPPFVNDLWCFDVDTQTWTLVNDGTGTAPPARISAFGGFFIDGIADKKLLVAGGEAFDTNTFSFVTANDTWEYSFDTNTWTLVTSFDLPPRAFGAGETGKFQRKIRIYGGDGDLGGAGCLRTAIGLGNVTENPLGDTQEFVSFNIDKWFERKNALFSHPPPPLKRHASVQVDKWMFVFGGFDFECSENQQFPFSGTQIFNHDVHRVLNL